MTWESTASRSGGGQAMETQKFKSLSGIAPQQLSKHFARVKYKTKPALKSRLSTVIGHLGVTARTKIMEEVMRHFPWDSPGKRRESTWESE